MQAIDHLGCPLCNSRRVWKDGLRYTRDGEVQRFICRECGHRFSANLNRSDPPEHVQIVHTNESNSSCTLTLDRRVCATEPKGAKNLVRVEIRQQQPAGGITTIQKPTAAENVISIFRAWMQNEGYKQATVDNYADKIQRLLNKGADLWNPQNVKELIAKDHWDDGGKRQLTYAYQCFLEMEGLTWKKPRYRQPQKIPFIPLESEIDELIAGCGNKVSTFLQGLKETGTDPGELLQVKWTDIDKARKLVTINHPVKGHNPRTLQISKKWITMLGNLRVTSERIFGHTQYRFIYSNFYMQRKRVARKLANPRILKMKFTTLRHWKGTMEYHKTKDIMYVKDILGHKSVKNTEIYIHFERQIFSTFNTGEFTCKVATTVEEDRELIEAGFEFVTERDGVKIYRKLK